MPNVAARRRLVHRSCRVRRGDPGRGGHLAGRGKRGGRHPLRRPLPRPERERGGVGRGEPERLPGRRDPDPDRQPAGRALVGVVQPGLGPERHLDLRERGQRRRTGPGLLGVRDPQPRLRRSQRGRRPRPEPVPDLGHQLLPRARHPYRHRDPRDRRDRPADLPQRRRHHRPRPGARHRRADHQVGQRQREGLPRRRPLGLEQRRRPGQPAGRRRGAPGPTASSPTSRTSTPPPTRRATVGRSCPR